MITAKTKQQKIALAKALEEHDPDFLADLKMLSGVFGPMREVSYEADDFEKHRKVIATAWKALSQ